jgi:replicative DNA helicase
MPEEPEEKIASFTNIRPLLTTVFESLDKIYHQKTPRGITSNITELDTLLGGFRKGELIIVASFPSAGKTTLCQHIVRTAANAKKPVAVFSLTRTSELYLEQLIAAQSRVDRSCLSSGGLNAENWEQIALGVQQLWEASLYIQDKCPTTVSELAQDCKTLQKTVPLSMVVIDDLLFLENDSEAATSSSSQQGKEAVARALKVLARQLDVPVVVACPLTPHRDSDMPALSDLAGMEGYADVVLLLHRANASEKASETFGEERQLIIAKNREGLTGTCPIVFYPAQGAIKSAISAL